MLQIVRRDGMTFLGALALMLVAGALFFVLQPRDYKTTLILNVTRDTYVASGAYEYDQFYRLQADERFADTVVQWISSASLTKRVFADDGAKIRARRLSSQVIEVTYRTHTAEDAAAAADRITNIVNTAARSLNERQSVPNWFMVVPDAPVSVPGAIPATTVCLASIVAGVFVGFWTVLLRHYFAAPRAQQQLL